MTKTTVTHEVFTPRTRSQESIQMSVESRRRSKEKQVYRMAKEWAKKYPEVMRRVFREVPVVA